MIKVYLGGPFDERWKLKEMRDYLSTPINQFRVTSRWLDNEFPSNDSPTDEQKYELCAWNQFDILQSDITVILDPEEYQAKGTPGRHIEIGYAIAMRLPVILIGQRRSVMHFDPLIRVMTIQKSFLEVKEEIERVYEEHWKR